MLSPETSSLLDFAVKYSIHYFMDNNLKKYVSILNEETNDRILTMFRDCENSLEEYKPEDKYDISRDHCITGRFVLWNCTVIDLLYQKKEELVEWSNTVLTPDPLLQSKNPTIEFSSLIWMAYLNKNFNKVKEYYEVERRHICYLYGV